MKYFLIFLIFAVAMISVTESFAEEQILMILDDRIMFTYYDGQNIISAFYDSESSSVIFETGNNAILDVKIPKLHKHGEELFVLRNSEESIVDKQTDDCFYNVTLQTQHPEKIEFIISYWPEQHTKLADNCEKISSAPLKQIQLGISPIEIKCREGKFVAYKLDNSKSACVTPDTLRELVSREWAFPHHNHASWKVNAHTTIQLKETCTDKNQILVQGGYYPTRGSELEFKKFTKTETEGIPGVAITLSNPTDYSMGSSRTGNANVFVDCINPNVENFYECQEASHYTNTKNWPILECRTLDGKQFLIDENAEMAKNSGIEIYTINYLSSSSLEFVGKTDRVDKVISFSITAPNGDEISTWSEFAPSAGEFRIAVTTGGPLWKQQDGTFILTAKQADVSYYETFSEFELEDGKIIR